MWTISSTYAYNWFANLSTYEITKYCIINNVFGRKSQGKVPQNTHRQIIVDYEAIYEQ